MKYFHYEELIRTDTGLPNFPNEEQLNNLEALVDNVLDPAREKLGFCIVVTSGFRSRAVNKEVGGSVTSQHMRGEAADLKTTNNRYNRQLFEVLKTLPYDQLLWEFGSDDRPAWVHVSYRKDGNNRNETLRAAKVKGKTVYTKIP